MRRKELCAARGLFSYRVGNNVLLVVMNCETMLVTVIIEDIIEENVVQEHTRMPPPPPYLNNEDMLY